MIGPSRSLLRKAFPAKRDTARQSCGVSCFSAHAIREETGQEGGTSWCIAGGSAVQRCCCAPEDAGTCCIARESAARELVQPGTPPKKLEGRVGHCAYEGFGRLCC